MTTRTRPVLALAALVVAAPLLLTGCSLVHVPSSIGGISLPGSGKSGGGISIPGLGSVGTGTLPSSWPKAVPVIDGEVLAAFSAGSGAATDGRGWNATIKVDGADAYTTIRAQLQGAGFAIQAEPDAGDADGGTGTFLKDPDDVLVVVTKADDGTGWVANYTVTEGTDNG